MHLVREGNIRFPLCYKVAVFLIRGEFLLLIFIYLRAVLINFNLNISLFVEESECSGDYVLHCSRITVPPDIGIAIPILCLEIINIRKLGDIGRSNTSRGTERV